MNRHIETHALSKRFRRDTRGPGLGGLLTSLLRPTQEEVVAVRALDLSVEAGESLALIGPNGAGKSTTLKMLTGILHPSAGEARVLGLVPWRDRARLAMNLATVFGQRSQLWYDLPASDSFELLAHIYELPRADYRARRQSLVERFALGSFLETPVRKLSLGQRMRCEIAASLLHRPRLILLDEPTIGLDVLVKQEIRALVRELNVQEGVTVVLTSHDAGDIERLCQRVVVIHHGGMVFDGGVSELRARYLSKKRIELKLHDAPRATPALPGVRLVGQGAFSLSLEVDTGQEPIERVLAELVQSQPIADITVEDTPLEEVIGAIYRAPRGSEAGP